LRRIGLPQPDDAGDKEERGRILVVGGAPQMPGAVILAATAALRAGAGKLQIATAASVAAHVGTAVPEAYIVTLPELKSGALASAAAKEIVEHANKVQAVLVGPGMVDEEATVRLMKTVLQQLTCPVVILDAAPLALFAEEKRILHDLPVTSILTPHAGEMASMLAMDKERITHDPLGIARRAAAEFDAIVALKGAETFIAAPPRLGSESFVNSAAGNVGLATSGSGDTLSGIIAGLVARGVVPLHAAVWGVYLHGAAGDKLAARMGRLGFLARELLAEIPELMNGLTARKKR
jgi:hydroxyethylthiazole kinase-like uncharacterized protein yjeF